MISLGDTFRENKNSDPEDDEKNLLEKEQEFMREAEQACREMARLVLNSPEQAEFVSQTIADVVDRISDHLRVLVELLDSIATYEKEDRFKEKLKSEYLYAFLENLLEEALIAAYGEELAERVLTIVYNMFPFAALDALSSCREWFVEQLGSCSREEASKKVILFNRLATQLVLSIIEISRTIMFIGIVGSVYSLISSPNKSY